MKRFYPFLVLCVFGILICLFDSARGFEKQAIPRYKGDDDPAHDNQPAWCQNYDDATFSHNCSCQAAADKGDSCKHPDAYGPDTWGEDEMPRCGTHCRRDACQCQRSCTS